MANQFDRIDPSRFEFVQAEKKLYDKKFQTKPIGYFKDAMIRFGKNKTNIVATSILFILITLSIFVPVLSKKDIVNLQPEIAYLPPRIPLLEDLGIFDGTVSRVDQPVDLSTIDPETGLGLPDGVPVEYIKDGTLENYYVSCTATDVEVCTGGQSILQLDATSSHVAVISTETISLLKAKQSVLRINVTEFNLREGTTQAELNVLLKLSFAGEYQTVATITEPGVYDVNLWDRPGLNLVFSNIKLEFVSDMGKNQVMVESVEIYDNTSEEAVYSDTGYDLAQYDIDETDGGAGAYLRQNGKMLMASYRYRSYEAALGLKNKTMPQSEYDVLLAEYGDACTVVENPDNPDGWLLSEGCPIVEVLGRTEPVWVGGVAYYSYFVVIDYAIYSGYDGMPYFLFGTNADGHDLFTMIFLAMRTSLLIGLMVAAVNISVGVIYGAIEGYYGGTVDLIMERFSEIMGRIPWLVTLSIFITLLGPGLRTLLLILIVDGWIGPASVTRTQFYRYKGREYVLASRTLGAKDARLIFRHILPNAIGTIITSSILMIPYVIFSEATISYLGYGIGHGSTFTIFGIEMTGVSLGVLLNDGRNTMLTSTYLTIIPAIMISVLMISFNMFGNALRDAFNPALRGAE